MQLGIFAKTFERGSVADVFSAVAGAGYSSVQFNLTCAGLPMLPVGPVAETVLENIEQAMATHRISIPAISGTFNMVHPDRGVVEAGLNGLKLLADVCRRLHIPAITLCTGTRDRENMWREHPENGSAAAWSDLRAAIERALELTAGGDIFLTIEPEPANVVHSAPVARRLLDEIPSPRLGITMDAANLARGRSAADDREIFIRAFALLGERIVLAHAKDKTADGKICPTGRGVVDFPFFVERLKAAHFFGSLIVHGIAENEAKPASDFLRTLL